MEIYIYLCGCQIKQNIFYNGTAKTHFKHHRPEFTQLYQ